MSQIDIQAARKPFQLHEKDTGSSDVQVAVLTKRIEHLTEHLKSNKHDHNSRRGLIMMVNRRRKLLDYLKRTDEPREEAAGGKIGRHGGRNRHGKATVKPVKLEPGAAKAAPEGKGAKNAERSAEASAEGAKKTARPNRHRRPKGQKPQE